MRSSTEMDCIDRTGVGDNHKMWCFSDSMKSWNAFIHRMRTYILSMDRNACSMLSFIHFNVSYD